MRYYYGQLSRPLQGVYDALLGGFRALAPGVRIPMLDEKQLADVYLSRCSFTSPATAAGG